ncbi:hypothetical protein C8J55DRAFT_11602 [Lentinula edodes]|uniref:Uncharacterized protein n=1 Tax=Lentinula lateritia TaxID=40482 RepID=A0A9W9E1R0_9AGAR|nr:hypothetical protein C8J55DRAFT_11602 [Lentinula edodes]
MSSKPVSSEDILGQKYDRCLADFLVKTCVLHPPRSLHVICYLQTPTFRERLISLLPHARSPITYHINKLLPEEWDSALGSSRLSSCSNDAPFPSLFQPDLAQARPTLTVIGHLIQLEYLGQESFLLRRLPRLWYQLNPSISISYRGADSVIVVGVGG